MKPSILRRSPFSAALATLCLHAAAILPAAAATLVIGSGADSSHFVIESPNLGLRTYEIRYDHDPSTPFDSAFLLFQVGAADSELAMAISNFGSAAQPNYFLNAITANGVTESGTLSPPYTPYWSHWVAGGEAGFPSASPVDGNTWTTGSGLSAPYRFIAPGSWDALVFSDGVTPPSVDAIPEPSGLLLLAGGGLCWVFRRRVG